MADVNCRPLCSICHQIYIKPAALPCGHTFCVSCLCAWLHRRRVCPHCTRKVPVRFRPIGLCGWDDVLESLAQLLPDEERQERQLSKRLREEEEDNSKQAKRRRTIVNGNNWDSFMVVNEGIDGPYLTITDHPSYPDDLEDLAADDWEEDWIDGEEVALEEQEQEEEEAVEEGVGGDDVIEAYDDEDSLTEEVEDENGDYFADASNNAVSVTSNHMANLSQYMNASNSLQSPNGRSAFNTHIYCDSQGIIRTGNEQVGNFESDDDDDDDDDYAF